MRLFRLLTPLLALAVPLAACSDDDAETTAPSTTGTTIETTTFAPSLGVDVSAAGWTKTASGLYYRTLASATGTSATVANGQRVSVRYTGWLANGTQFESSTFAFTLGRGEVIAGWDQGIVGMRVGERRQLVIPPALGYGARANGPIPANAVLVFNVEVLSAT
ncbi:MAG: FKBP-type peptidyl-prolyl cis-trans isomerase [Gemmatirosa sp.]